MADEAHIDIPKVPQLETSSEESIPTSNPDIIKLIQETETMEVHKHPHHVTHRKKWGEYLLEFLMLFLAVFLGFIAENIRENSVNRQTEKNNIESLVRNLREDSVSLIKSIEINEKRFIYLDNLIALKNEKVNGDTFHRQFIYYMLKLAYLNYFTSNQSTFEQMKSSGTLRLIHPHNVLDSILNYETGCSQLKSQEEICSRWWNKAIEQVSSVVDLTALANLPPDNLWVMTEQDLDGIVLPDITKDMPGLQSYYNWRVNEKISLGYYLRFLNNQLTIVKTLIPFLNQEYHLENE
jgi:hypothetical protein